MAGALPRNWSASKNLSKKAIAEHGISQFNEVDCLSRLTPPLNPGFSNGSVGAEKSNLQKSMDLIFNPLSVRKDFSRWGTQGYWTLKGSELIDDD